MTLEFFAASGSATAAGVFIPISDLPGIVATELAGTESEGKKLGRSIYSILKQVYSVLSPTSFAKLGVTVGRSEASGGFGLSNKTYVITYQFVGNVASSTVGYLPVPTSGTSNGVGDFALKDVFPNATKVAANGSTGGAGVLIPSAELEPLGSPTYAALNITAGQDNRSWFGAFSLWTVTNLPVRSSSVESAFTAVSRGSYSATTLPTGATDSPNPTTGLLATDLLKTFAVSVSYSVTVQIVDNEITDTFDVNVVKT